MEEYKIEYAKEVSKEKINEILHPLVKEWFFSKFENFSKTQLYGVIPIWKRKNTLISAPTGGTKTLTAFLSILNYLIILAEKNELEDKVYVIYTSPLRALSNDIYVNLITPLNEIEEIAKKRNIKLQKIRISLRTGDTTIKERQEQLKKPPHILITTPETLSIIITSKKFIEKLDNVEYVIIDEIHSLANKRGTHLSLSLERLKEISYDFVRIGLSATISPLEEIAKFLIGSSNECVIANVNFEKKLDVNVLYIGDIFNENKEINKYLYEVIDNLIQQNKTTLIFTNTRSATERVVNHLKEIFPNKYLDDIGAHHGSLSREYRFDIEKKLREGKLKVIVSSTSLELGIDIGYIDMVILLGSPKSVARALQRIGRAGHKLHDTIKGRFIVLDKDDLVECSIMLKNIIERKIDNVEIPKNCLDVLSQHIYGMAITKKYNIKDMFNIIRGSYCYKYLSYEDFLSVISYLAGEYALEDKRVYAKIWYDEKTGEIGKKGKLARMIYMTNIGTIPEESFISVILRKDGKEIKIGNIDESFFERMKKGDVFVLGGNKYVYMFSRGMKLYVSQTIDRPPTIPSWFSEILPLSFDLALDIQRFRKLINERINKEEKEDIIKFIEKFCYIKKEIAEEIYNYFLLQNDYIGIPHLNKIIIENYKVEKNYYIFHSLFGRRVNDALSRAIAFILAKQNVRDIEIGINDNGFYLIGENINKEKIEKTLNFINENNLEEILKEAIEKSEILKRRFRHCASRALTILRNYKGNKKSIAKLQLKSSFLIDSVRRLDNNFPILKETRREILEDVMDIKNAKKVINWIKNKDIKIEFKETRICSPFAINLILQSYYDIIKIEDKLNFIKRVYEEIKKNSIKNL
ncbi:MAG: ATP-dependent helicase [Candidatus Pacearchaeota archaeon]